MAKDLERDLGLYAVFTISVGAMIGSGIFVLPGKAAEIAGPAVVLAYLLAGVIVLPAALSKSEMATAMPESGGTYLYIDRAMGPLAGTVAGIGAWFSLVFKSAFALVGLGAYLVLFSNLPTKPVALALAALLVVVNVAGVKQSGRLQAVIVTVVLAALLAFVANGITFVESAHYHPFFASGEGAVLAGAGFVFVSYAGVTKIASVAEEVENPGRNIPLGMIGSVLLMMLVYTLVVFVMVGVTSRDDLAGTLTPVTAAAEQFLGPAGAVVLAGIAVLALVSMANAGVLSSSRFPFAMSRDSLAPAALGRVHSRFRTPTYAIAVTGSLLLVLVAFVPVVELAKLASAFKILVFSLVNVALIAFRESELDSYDPEFVAPGYPWLQLFGLAGGLALLTQMGALPIAGAVGIVVVGLAWYRVYGRSRTDREGAALDAIRRSTDERAIERTREACSVDELQVLVPFAGGPGVDKHEAVSRQLRFAADLVRDRGGRVQVVRFDEIPEQLTLSSAAVIGEPDVDGPVLADDDGAISRSLGVDVESGEVVTHDTNRAVVNFAEENDVDLVLGEWHPVRWHAELLGTDVDWYMEHAPVDLVFVRNRGLDDVERVVVIADEGPFDPLEVLVADGVASANDARIDFLTALPSSTSDEQVESAWEYLNGLADLCTSETKCTVLRDDDREAALVAATEGADLAVVGTSAHNVVYDVLFGSLPDRLVESLDCTVAMAHSRKPRHHTFLRAILDRFVY